MAIKDKPIKKKKSLKERLKEQRENLGKRGNNEFITFKEGTTRIRILSPGDEQEFAIEVVYFYLGMKNQYQVISPKTFGGKCAFYNASVKMSESKDEEDRAFAKKKLKIGKRYIAAGIKYKDDRGREIDAEMGLKPILMAGSIYQGALDLWLDDDNGDFTDPINGYDLKVKRTGKGQMDTEYTVLAGKPSKLPKEYRMKISLEELVKGVIPTYEQTKTLLDEYLNLPPEEEEEVKSKKSKGTKKKKRRSDL